jgi:hypothetical protein
MPNHQPRPDWRIYHAEGLNALQQRDYALLMVEARGVEPLSSSLSAQTSTCLSGEKF